MDAFPNGWFWPIVRGRAGTSNDSQRCFDITPNRRQHSDTIRLTSERTGSIERLGLAGFAAHLPITARPPSAVPPNSGRPPPRTVTFMKVKTEIWQGFDV
jgi:hypothetical protein